MNVPTNLKYTKDHEWVLIKGNEATVGITDFAQHELGDIVFIEIETVGEEIHAHRGVLGERDLGGGSIDEPACGLSDLEQLLVARQRFAIGVFVGPRREIGFDAANALGQRLYYFAR